MRVFISHAWEDRDFANKLSNALTQRGLSVWSPTSIPPGAHWRSAITREIGNADVVVPIISPAAEQNLGMAMEVATVLAERERGNRPRLIPVQTGPVENCPVFVRQFQWVDFSDGSKFVQNADRLASAILHDSEQAHVDLDEAEDIVVITQRMLRNMVSATVEARQERQSRQVATVLSVSLATAVAAAAFAAGWGVTQLLASAWNLLLVASGALLGALLSQRIGR